MHAWCPTPDELPFSENVHTRSLVQLVQCGLAFDAISAKISGQPRSFRFGRDHGPPNPLQPNIRRAMEERVSRTELPYYPSQHRLLETPATPLHMEDNDSVKHNHVDAMDVDASLVDEPESDAEITILNAATPPLSTADPGVNAAIQSDSPLDLVERTVLLDLGSAPGATVANLRWNDVDSRIITVFAGSRMSHFFINRPSDLFAQLYTSRTFEGPDFEISKVCWTAGEDCVVYGADRKPAHDDSEADMGLLEKVWYVGGGGIRVSALASYMGLVMASRWNEVSKRLLSVSATLSSTTIRVWTQLDSLPRPRAFNVPLTCYDATWISPTRFVICADKSVDLYELTDTDNDAPARKVRSISSSFKWESVEFDPQSELLAFVSFEDNAIGLIDSDLNGSLVSKAYEDGRITSLAFQPGQESLPSVDEQSVAPETEPRTEPEAMETSETRLQDEPNTKSTEGSTSTEQSAQTTADPTGTKDKVSEKEANDGKSVSINGQSEPAARPLRLIAVSLDSGVIDLLGLNLQTVRSQSENTEAGLTTLRRMCMPGVGAYATAFSPNGRFFAAAGVNCVLVWEISARLPLLTALSDPISSGPDTVPRAEWRWPLDKSGRWASSSDKPDASVTSRVTTATTGIGSTTTATDATAPTPSADADPQPDKPDGADTATNPLTPAVTVTAVAPTPSPPDRDAELRHELKWDRNGKKLAFALDGQVAIIQFG